MFYTLITKKRDEWLASKECTIGSLLEYIEQRGMMRDAQIDAIKTYLYLKIACQNKPLYELFCQGRFNEDNLSQEELTIATREVLSTNPAALALFQYSKLKDKNGVQTAPKLEEYIRHHAANVDYKKVFYDIFSGVDYADYLFSLPMGAGKTFLMSAFIYLDLYFAQLEPDNPIWAHNFLVLAPSGLKSSIIPSLRNIRSFDPSWLFSEETAIKLKRLIHFEILDEQKSEKKSNTVRNPNAHKVNMYLGTNDTLGLIAVTNAEKVILDRVDKDTDPSLYSEEENRKITVANELRNVIGQIPHLAIFIDEVHHASDNDIKLRQVVNDWVKSSNSVTNVLGFSGTPYLESAKPITICEDLSIKNTNISNVVDFYPLINGIDNFLKRPTIKYVDSDSATIISHGVREFLETYKDTTYTTGACAKLAIYCGQIATLEEQVYPLVSQLVLEYGLNPTEVILKRHQGSTKKGEKRYPEPEGSQAAFASLDTPVSKIRIVLLVQIGKEGWDCKSLTGIILPHEGACPTNMVLQTSCRCLRQTQRGAIETALIWMNKFNADKLNKELKQQQNITLNEFANKPQLPTTIFNRYSRMDSKQLPPIEFYQLKVEYRTISIPNQPDTKARLSDSSILVTKEQTYATTQDLEGKVTNYSELKHEEGEAISYVHWLQRICRESFGTLVYADLLLYDAELHSIYEKIMTDGKENPDFDHQRIRSLIRQTFVPKRDFEIEEEVVPDQASLLAINNFRTQFDTSDPSKIYPQSEAVQEILDWDKDPNKGNIPEGVQAIIKQLRESGKTQDADTLENSFPKITDPHPEREQTYHYLPYRFDSTLERNYFVNGLINALKGTNLEFYFNGAEELTEFKIRCYKQVGKHLQYDGYYYPDFVVLRRDEQNQIDKICIIETKGAGFEANFEDRLKFMKETFVPKNNTQFKYERFEFLYLPEKLSDGERFAQTQQMITKFFNA